MKLDALAALSLMGYCDEAYNGFVELTKYRGTFIREQAVSCLAYYIGTDAAIKIISDIMVLDPENSVQDEARKVLGYYWQQNGENKNRYIIITVKF